MKRKQGCEVEAIGINYTIHTSHNKPTFFNLFKRTTQKPHHHTHNADQLPTVFGCLKVLTDVNCHAKPWEILAMVGPSGAKKSSLLEILAGKITLESDFVYVNDKQPESTHFRRISGYVTQNNALFPLLIVEETLFYSARLHLFLPTSHLLARVTATLAELLLTHVAATRVGSVSGGECRRVSIGIVLIHEPQVLILDEPTSGLDSC